MLSDSSAQYLRSSRGVMRALQLTLGWSLNRFNWMKRAWVTRSRIHCRNQHEFRGKRQRPSRSRDRYFAVLERLAHDFEH